MWGCCAFQSSVGFSCCRVLMISFLFTTTRKSFGACRTLCPTFLRVFHHLSPRSDWIQFAAGRSSTERNGQRNRNTKFECIAHLDCAVIARIAVVSSYETYAAKCPVERLSPLLYTSLHFFPFSINSTPVRTTPMAAPVCIVSLPPPLSLYSMSARPDIQVTMT